LKRRVLALLVALGLALAAGASGSLELRLGASYAPAAGFGLEARYAASLLVSERWGGAFLEAALYPSWNLASGELEAGLSRLEVGYTAGDLAFGLGAGPEPLATLHTLAPFELAQPRFDYAPGLWGAWAEAYPDPDTRLRLALRLPGGHPAGIFKAEKRLARNAYRLALVYGLAPAPAAFGAGFSTRAGSVLLYGEAWHLWRESAAWRGGAGASFYLLDGLLELEAAYAGGWRLAAGYNFQPDEDWLAAALVRADLPGEAGFSLSLTRLLEEGDVIFELAARRDAAGVLWLPALSARVYY